MQLGYIPREGGQVRGSQDRQHQGEQTRQENGKEIESKKVIYFGKKSNLVRRLHAYRRSLSSFLTTRKKLDPKTAQTALSQSDVHSR
jgi:hypothetical protein